MLYFSIGYGIKIIELEDFRLFLNCNLMKLKRLFMQQRRLKLPRKKPLLLKDIRRELIAEEATLSPQILKKFHVFPVLSSPDERISACILGVTSGEESPRMSLSYSGGTGGTYPPARSCSRLSRTESGEGGRG